MPDAMLPIDNLFLFNGDFIPHLYRYIYIYICICMYVCIYVYTYVS